MSAGTRRLERLYPALTGKEAGKLVLSDYKARKQHDTSIASGLRDRETREYNRRVDIINFANAELFHLIGLLKEQVTAEGLRLALLAELHEHVRDLSLMRLFIKEMVKEPVTESELSAKRTKVPRWRLFDVYKDEDADEVEALRKNWTLLDQVLRRRGGDIELPMELLADGDEVNVDDGPRFARLLASETQTRLIACWTQLQAVRLVLDEYAEDFDGEDLLRPETRECLDDALLRIEVMREGLAHYIGEWTLPDDHSEAVELVRQLAERVRD